MNMERLFNSPLEEGYVSIDGLNYNVTVDVIFAPPPLSDSLFQVWLIGKTIVLLLIAKKEAREETSKQKEEL